MSSIVHPRQLHIFTSTSCTDSFISFRNLLYRKIFDFPTRLSKYQNNPKRLMRPLRKMRLQKPQKNTPMGTRSWGCSYADSYVYGLCDHSLEHGLGNAADRAYPIRREIFKGRPRRDAMLRITLLGVIGVTAGIAEILVHTIHLLSS